MTLTGGWLLITRICAGNFVSFGGFTGNRSLGCLNCRFKSRFFLIKRVDARSYHSQNASIPGKPCFLVRFPAIVPRSPNTVINPKRLLWNFLYRSLGVIDPNSLSIQECWMPETTVLDAHFKASQESSGDRGLLWPSLMFRLNNESDARLLWDLYNIERCSLAECGTFLVNTDLPDYICRLHRAASAILPSLRKSNRSLRFHDDGVSEGDRSFSSQKELLGHVVPHRLLVYGLIENDKNPDGQRKKDVPLLAMSTCQIMGLLCSRLGLVEPQRVFVGAWNAFPIHNKVDGAPTNPVLAQFGTEKDKCLVMNRFRELVETELYDGILRLSDVALSPEVRQAHGLAYRLMPYFRKAGLRIQLTDLGIEVDGQSFANADDLYAYFNKHWVIVWGIDKSLPHLLETESSLKSKIWSGDVQDTVSRVWSVDVQKIVHQQLSNLGLHLPPGDLLAIVSRRDFENSFRVLLSTQEAKDRLLNAYATHRWRLWGSAIRIEDSSLGIDVRKIHKMAMSILSASKYYNMRDLCEFTETGVILEGHLCESIKELLDHIEKIDPNQMNETHLFNRGDCDARPSFKTKSDKPVMFRWLGLRPKRCSY